MIPYDELVESLANWRSKNGMSVRQSGRYQAAEEGTDLHGSVPENDFQRQDDGTGEIDLSKDVVYGEGEDDA